MRDVTGGSTERAEGSASAESPGTGQGKPTIGSGSGLLEIDRVLDVPLVVTLRFGQREMRLREVLELSAGSLVELDRQIEDPVDLLLGDRIIARGEVVIVDGSYGLRVTEVFQQGASLPN